MLHFAESMRCTDSARSAESGLLTVRLRIAAVPVGLVKKAARMDGPVF